MAHSTIARYLFLPVLLFSLPALAQADTIRCGTALIREGTTAIKIRETCGEPATVEHTTEPVYGRRQDGTTTQVGTVPVEIWYFDFGSRRNPVRMTVKYGLAEKIERLRRNQ